MTYPWCDRTQRGVDRPPERKVTGFIYPHHLFFSKLEDLKYALHCFDMGIAGRQGNVDTGGEERRFLRVHMLGSKRDRPKQRVGETVPAETSGGWI